MILIGSVNIDLSIKGKGVEMKTLDFNTLLNIAASQEKSCSIEVKAEDMENIDNYSRLSDVTLRPGPTVSLTYTQVFPNNDDIPDMSIPVTVIQESAINKAE